MFTQVDLTRAASCAGKDGRIVYGLPERCARGRVRNSGPMSCRSLIGVGGMGEVYRAYDTAKERMVAIKLLRAEVAADPSFQERFRRESRMAARLQEPHVIPVHDFGDIDGALYIDMRLVEGASLKDELRRQRRPRRRPARCRSSAQVAAALDAAHASGLVHRDIKPENVLLTPDDFAYLVDFGIANAGGDSAVTMTGMIIGSCAYMATERFSGRRGGPAVGRVLADLPALRVPDRPGALRGGRPAAVDERAHVLAAAAAEHHASRDQPRASTTSSPAAWPRTRPTGTRRPANWPRQQPMPRRAVLRPWRRRSSGPPQGPPQRQHAAVLRGRPEPGRRRARRLPAAVQRLRRCPGRRRAKSRFGPTQVALVVAIIVLVSAP